jgi:hypothetical protein
MSQEVTFLQSHSYYRMALSIMDLEKSFIEIQLVPR